MRRQDPVALADAGVEVDTSSTMRASAVRQRGRARPRGAARHHRREYPRARRLRLRFSDQLIRNRGGLLNVGSIAGFLPGPGMAMYYASKAFVLSFTEALRVELGQHGVRVTVLCPGPVRPNSSLRAGFQPGSIRPF